MTLGKYAEVAIEAEQVVYSLFTRDQSLPSEKSAGSWAEVNVKVTAYRGQQEMSLDNRQGRTLPGVLLRILFPIK